MAATLQIAVVPQREPQERQTLARLSHLDDACLLTIDRQPEASFEQPLDPIDQLPRLIACQDHKVISVSHKLGVGPRSGSVAAAVSLFEPMQVQVSEEGRNHTSLRRALFGSRNFLPAMVIGLDDGT